MDFVADNMQAGGATTNPRRCIGDASSTIRCGDELSSFRNGTVRLAARKGAKSDDGLPTSLTSKGHTWRAKNIPIRSAHKCNDGVARAGRFGAPPA